MHHRYFDGIDWDAARKKEIQVPMIPDIEGEDDTSYFEEYDEDDEDMDDVSTPHSRSAAHTLQRQRMSSFLARSPLAFPLVWHTGEHTVYGVLCTPIARV